MDAEKIGKVIKDCRKEKGMTQKELAEKLMISDKTISKWERGLGCPDISFLTELSKILGVNIENILRGNIEINDFIGGNSGTVHNMDSIISIYNLAVIVYNRNIVILL